MPDPMTQYDYVDCLVDMFWNEYVSPDKREGVVRKNDLSDFLKRLTLPSTSHQNDAFVEHFDGRRIIVAAIGTDALDRLSVEAWQIDGGIIDRLEKETADFATQIREPIVDSEVIYRAERVIESSLETILNAVSEIRGSFQNAMEALGE